MLNISEATQLGHMVIKT